MKKTGKQRKTKRKAKVVADKEVIAIAGEHWLPNGPREEKVSNSLIRKSLRWNTESGQDLLGKLLDVEEEKGKPDLTDDERKALHKKQIDLVRQLKARDIAIAVTSRNMLSSNPLVVNLAVSNLIRMEAQNQADQHHDEGETQNVNHNHSVTLTVEARRNLIADVAKRLGAGDVVEAISVKSTKRPAKASVGVSDAN